MSKRYYFAVITVVILCFVFLIPELSFGQEKETNYDALAQKLVYDCAAINEGDLVLVSGGVRDLTLLEDICVQVRKKGAFPLLTVGSDRMTKRMYVDVPVEYDAQLPAFTYELAKIVDVIISVDYNESMDLLSDIPPERFVTRSTAADEINKLLMTRNVRMVSLGNGLYPTAQRAEVFALSPDELANIFWSGVNVDYSVLHNSCSALKQSLSAAKALHITNANGTDFTVQIEDRPIFISDGVISEDDLQTGGAACQVWLPAGEVYLTPMPGTAEGTIVVERQYYNGKTIKNLKLTFSEGKMTDMSAESGLEFLQEYYNSTGSGRDLFGIIDFGINPNVKISPDNQMVCWVAEGMISVGVGNNEWAGGNNESSFFMASFLPGSTVALDGKVIINQGKLIY